MRKGKSLLLLAAVLCFGNLFAQTAPAETVEMADGMRSSGKIYVVVASVVIILAGLLLYVISVERKVKKLEKTIEEQRKK